MRDYHELNNEIARLRFRQYSLPTDDPDCKILEQEILELIRLQSRLSEHNDSETES